ncbi:hypothetical protein [Paenisporosarcina cavernae]|uniref:DUF3221 domain-containing protein n=1 Tax=Paenisporosarcina cavernae TaxID=2320858 RepID=A0A385YPZ2_9BACL|nr:hypothetical protein [Paenisporosarcina cavernae]AYC28410.1 hypothetical protein D3873_00435 [Paenisporosarcina cavernae]
MKLSYILLLLLSVTVSGCTSTSFTEDFRINGTIKEVIQEEEMLLIEGTPASGGNLATYEIPVASLYGYEEGQKVEVIVYSNTDADVWHLDNMKFDITLIE